ncbi:MAG: hypothetical protein Tsb009_20050 [Planctomycetaceae bacterium]
MFGWFSPKCPLDDPREKAWVEWQMLWLTEQLGRDRLKRVEVLVPAPDEFPEYQTGSDSELAILLERVARQMDANPSKFQIQIVPDEKPHETLRKIPEDESEHVIVVRESQRKDFSSLLATLSRHLMDHLLQTVQKLEETEEGYPHLLDLGMVYFGLGIFGANVTFRDFSESDGSWHYWHYRREGFLASRHFGYALALFAWLRGEHAPHWAEYLRLDARDVFWKSLRYLEKTGDSLFNPDWAGMNRDEPSLPDLLDDLQSRSASRRVAALWKIEERGFQSHEVRERVLRVTHDPHFAVRVEAVRILPMVDSESHNENLVPVLLELLRDPHAQVRAAAAEALGYYRNEPEVIVQELTASLADQSQDVIAAVAEALTQFGRLASHAAEALSGPLRHALVHCEYDLIDHLLTALTVIHKSPEDFLHHEYQDDDELRTFAEESLTNLQSESTESEEVD